MSLPNLFSDGPPTVVIDFLGSEAAVSWALQALGPRGRLVALTTFRDHPIPVEHRDFVFGEISLIGSRYATKREVATAADLVASGKVVPVLGEVVGPSDLLTLQEQLRSRQLVGRGALSWLAFDHPK